jgi:hypothetical protein
MRCYREKARERKRTRAGFCVSASDNLLCTYKVVWSAQLLYSILPMPLLSQKLVDFIVEIPDAKLAKAGYWLEEGKEKSEAGAREGRMMVCDEQKRWFSVDAPF